MLAFKQPVIKSPQQLRRMAAFAGVDTKDLSKLTMLCESAINNYFNDEMPRVNYLFQFILESLVEKKKKEIENRKTENQ